MIYPMRVGMLSQDVVTNLTSVNPRSLIRRCWIFSIRLIASGVNLMPTEPSDLDGLTILGRKSKPSKTLEASPKRSPDRYYLVSLETDEFTCLCPMTGQPDIPFYFRQ